ncbi:MAG: HAMP domain-containing protein, partial [Pseudomonadota bacterium]
MHSGRSFTTRLLLPVIGAAALVIVAGLYVDYRLSRDRLLTDLTASATYSVDSTLQRLDELRSGVESVVRLVSDAVHESPDATQADELLRGLVQSNEHIFAAALAFASSDDAPPAGRYVYRDERQDRLRYQDLASEPNYPGEWSWFERARDEGTAQWIGPYPAPRSGGEPRSRFSAALRDDDGNIFAAVAADVSLGSLTPYLDDLAIDTRGFGFLLTADRLVIGAPLGDVIVLPLAELYPALEASIDQEAGLHARVPCPRDAGTCELRIRNAGPGPWSVGVVYAADEVLKPLHDYARRVAIIGLFMLCLLAFLVTILTRRLTRPLRELAESSRAVARGELDGELPRVSGGDEVGDLVRAFDSMRRDLGNYIAALERSTARRARLDGEFAAAAEIQRSMLPGGGQVEVTDRRYALWAR